MAVNSGLALGVREYIIALYQFPVGLLSPLWKNHHVQISWEQFKTGQLLINGIIEMWESAKSQFPRRRLIRSRSEVVPRRQADSFASVMLRSN